MLVLMFWTLFGLVCAVTLTAGQVKGGLSLGLYPTQKGPALGHGLCSSLNTQLWTLRLLGISETLTVGGNAMDAANEDAQCAVQMH
jgi:hypothetical protein